MKDNAHIAELLRRYAGMLQLEGANRFKVKAYRRAADALDGLGEQAAELVRKGVELTEIAGVGRAIAAVILEIVETGGLAALEKKSAQLRPEVADLAGRPLLDPKLVLRVYRKLNIASLAELSRRSASGEIRDLFGPRVDYHIRRGLDPRPRALLWSALKLAPTIEAVLRAIPGVERVALTGSARRKQDTVGDLAFLVGRGRAAQIFRRFAKFGGVRSSEPRGRNAKLFRLSSGLGVSLHCTSMRNWEFTLLTTTGSRAHLDDLARRAKARRIGWRSQAFAGGPTRDDDSRIYARLGMQYVEPELREGRGEVESAVRDDLPQVVGVQDLQGDLHMHTTSSDGADSIVAMAEAARARGYRYIGITDHSQSLVITNGLSEKRLLRQIREIDRINRRLEGFTVLKSAEVDILEDGRLDYSQAMLRQLDFAICSIHSRCGLDRARQTERILRAMDNRYFTILGHATGRLLLKREGYDVDIERILEHAKSVGCFVEINSSPDRLDLSDEHAKLAKELGVGVAVNTDAHSIRELNFITAGINQARRGWLTATDVLNTRPLSALRKLFSR